VTRVIGHETFLRVMPAMDITASACLTTVARRPRTSTFVNYKPLSSPWFNQGLAATLREPRKFRGMANDLPASPRIKHMMRG
jgi:hypothetical protein